MSDEVCSSSEVLRDHMSSIHSISHRDTSGVVNGFEGKVHENLKLRERVIGLEKELKLAQETITLQSAELAFQRSESEAELESAKRIESDLRRTVAQVSANKSEVVNEIHNQFQRHISETEDQKQAFAHNLQVQVARLRTKFLEVQTENEAIKEDYQKTKHTNTDLISQISDLKQVYESKIALLEQYISTNADENGGALGALRSRNTDLEQENASLKNELRAAKRKIDDVDCQLQVTSEASELQKKQIREVTGHYNELSERLAEESRHVGELKALKETLQTRIDVMDTESKAIKRKLSEMVDVTRLTQSVAFCSPLQRVRIEILKGIARHDVALVTAVREVYPDVQVGGEMRGLALAVVFAMRWAKCTGKTSDICDHSQGLLPFRASGNSAGPKQMLISAKNDVASFRQLTQESREQLTEAIKERDSLEQRHIQERQTMETARLQLETERRCNRTMHDQLQSFVRFHDEMMITNGINVETE